MERFVHMEKLPADLAFPAEYRDRIHFDAATRRLVYRGFMSKSDFDLLCRLSDDWSYRRPLEELFRQCIPEVVSKPRGVRGLLSSLLGF
jgi:hypothetical protein